MHAPLSDQSALPDEDGRLGPVDANSRPAKSVTRANRRAPPCGIALAWARPVAGLSSPRHESVDAHLHMPRQVRIDSSRAGDPVPGCQQAGSISEATLPRQGRGLRTAAESTLSLPILTMILASTWPRQQRPQAGRGPERPRLRPTAGLNNQQASAPHRNPSEAPCPRFVEPAQGAMGFSNHGYTWSELW
jgi:hypothetical protein